MSAASRSRRHSCPSVPPLAWRSGWHGRTSAPASRRVRTRVGAPARGGARAGRPAQAGLRREESEARRRARRERDRRRGLDRALGNEIVVNSGSVACNVTPTVTNTDRIVVNDTSAQGTRLRIDVRPVARPQDEKGRRAPPSALTSAKRAGCGAAFSVRGRRRGRAAAGPRPPCARPDATARGRADRRVRARARGSRRARRARRGSAPSPARAAATGGPQPLTQLECPPDAGRAPPPRAARGSARAARARRRGMRERLATAGRR
jgi:hypothetical protein